MGELVFEHSYVIYSYRKPYNKFKEVIFLQLNIMFRNATANRFYSVLPNTLVNPDKYVEILEVPDDRKVGKIIFVVDGMSVPGEFTSHNFICEATFGEHRVKFRVFVRDDEWYLGSKRSDGTIEEFVLCDITPSYEDILFSETAVLQKAEF